MGYLIVKIVVDIVIGLNLFEIKNLVMQIIYVVFELVLDYVVVKIFWFVFDKFLMVDVYLGIQMKVMGEVMVIGLILEEVMFKVIVLFEIDFKI